MAQVSSIDHARIARAESIQLETGRSMKWALKVLLLTERDGSCCAIGGERMTLAETTLDHIVPASHGGCNDISNLRLACRTHNLRRGDAECPLCALGICDALSPTYRALRNWPESPKATTAAAIPATATFVPVLHVDVPAAFVPVKRIFSTPTRFQEEKRARAARIAAHAAARQRRAS